MLMHTVGVLLDYALSYDLVAAATQESQRSHRPGEVWDHSHPWTF
jgi:hypothetical protein